MNYFEYMNDLTPDSSLLTTCSTQLGLLLNRYHLTCTTAESCTGGMIGTAITSVAGSSGWFKGGVIAYSNEVKHQLLSVPEQTLLEHGAVSSETVAAMAEGAARLFSADCAISVSGIAGPGGSTAEKPVGLVYIGIYSEGSVSTFRHQFPGNRANVRFAATDAALHHLMERLKSNE